jgi:membrane protease subunit HflC
MKTPVFLIGFAVLAILLQTTLFTVDEREQAIVFQFGEAKAAHVKPGLKAKVPFLQSVVYYPKQALFISPPQQQVILADQKRLNVDSFAYFRISDPLKFFQNLRTLENANANLGDRINSTMREVLGRYALTDVLSDKREAIMLKIRENMNTEIETLGVQLVDVRIQRADLPQETSEAIFARMRSERERESREFRAQGEEEAQQIRSKADKERTVLIAEASRKAQEAKGEGDAKAIAIYAEAFNADPDFYGFYRSLEASRKSLGRSDTTLVLSPDSPFFEYFNKKAP